MQVARCSRNPDIPADADFPRIGAFFDVVRQTLLESLEPPLFFLLASQTPQQSQHHSGSRNPMLPPHNSSPFLGALLRFLLDPGSLGCIAWERLKPKHGGNFLPPPEPGSAHQYLSLRLNFL